MFKIEKLALEILDSRGRPTVQATCWLTGGLAEQPPRPRRFDRNSRGPELRDGDARRYRG